MLVDVTPPVLGVVKDTLPPRNESLDAYHPAVVVASSGSGSVSDINYQSNGEELMCAYTTYENGGTLLLL